MEELLRGVNEFNYSFQKRLAPRTAVVCKIPYPTGRAKSVKNITWYTTADVVVTACIAEVTNAAKVVWDKLETGADVSPAITAIKFDNTTNDYAVVCLRVLMD